MKLLDYFMKPMELPYDFGEWRKKPFPERVKMVCQASGMQGFGAPRFVVVFYSLKIALYVWLWFVFCSLSDDLGGWSTVETWWSRPEAIGKALFWTILLEVIGLGGASGPLTARYMPPLGAITYYLRPGTVKVPLFPKVPILGNDKRNFLDILLYIGLLVSLTWLCVAPKITWELVLPVVILLPVLGVIDRQIYLAARADVWYPCAVFFLFPLETGGALKMMWFGIWFWAAFSKLQPSFSSVVSVMICNSPFLNFKWLKRLLFRSYPNDLRLSRLATGISHIGTLVEFSLPISLMAGTLLGWDPSIMFYCLLGMTVFHTFIFVNFPMGVPMEWNVIMVYVGWALFYAHPDYHPSDVENPLIWAILGLSVVVLPILGNLFPRHISFLMSMRYYAGTWPYSVWLFKGNSKMEKLEPNIVKTSADLRVQLENYYKDETTRLAILSRVISFRFMHLPGRALQDLVPKAVDDIDDYYWQDGEFVAGEVAGWNFGDGHLHHETLLRSIQKRCNFAHGELRVIMVESPQLHTGKMHWRIHDAHDGLIEEGYTQIRSLREKMPWPEA